VEGAEGVAGGRGGGADVGTGPEAGARAGVRAGTRVGYGYGVGRGSRDRPESRSGLAQGGAAYLFLALGFAATSLVGGTRPATTTTATTTTTTNAAAAAVITEGDCWLVSQVPPRFTTRISLELPTSYLPLTSWCWCSPPRPPVLLRRLPARLAPHGGARRPPAACRRLPQRAPPAVLPRCWQFQPRCRRFAFCGFWFSRRWGRPPAEALLAPAAGTRRVVRRPALPARAALAVARLAALRAGGVLVRRAGAAAGRAPRGGARATGLAGREGRVGGWWRAAAGAECGGGSGGGGGGGCGRARGGDRGGGGSGGGGSGGGGSGGGRRRCTRRCECACGGGRGRRAAARGVGWLRAGTACYYYTRMPLVDQPTCP
jgi:hypothetical protein